MPTTNLLGAVTKVITTEAPTSRADADVTTRGSALADSGAASAYSWIATIRQNWAPSVKRGIDIILSATLLLVLSPVFVAVAVLILATSAGPVIFRQTRVGRDGELFEVLKFRTMVSNAEELLIDLRGEDTADGPLFKMRNDPRVTDVGRVLRRLSIDEIPQFINVLRGEMSLVGPRPALPAETLEWPDALHARLTVRPGITGLWQVSGRSDVSFEEYGRLDLDYVDNWSLRTDLAILARTAPAVLKSTGAY